MYLRTSLKVVIGQEEAKNYSSDDNGGTNIWCYWLRWKWVLFHNYMFGRLHNLYFLSNAVRVIKYKN